MGEKAKKKGRRDVEVMNCNIADGKEVQFLDDSQKRKMKERKKYDSSLDGMQESDFSKPSKKMRKVSELKIVEGEDGDQHKQIKKSGDESQHEDYNEDKDDRHYKKKEKKNKKLNKESKSEDKDDSHYKKEKKKLSKESKSQVYNEFETDEGGDDDQGKKKKKKKKKKKSGEDSQHEDCNQFKSNEFNDNGQYKKEKKRKKKKLSEESKSKEYSELDNNEDGDDDQGKKKKKKKSGEDSQHEDCNQFKSNEFNDNGQYKKEKKRKKKKLSEESKSKEYSELDNNEGEDDDQGKKMKKKKLRDKSKNKENSELNSSEGDQPSARVKSIATELDNQSKKTETNKKAKAGTGESPNPGHIGSSKPKRVTFSDQVDVCCDGLVRGKRFTPEEDKKIQMAVFDYIESHGLGDEGLDMVLHCNSHREIRDCWKEIGLALPERPYVSVYNRAHILFERGEERRWTPEEYEFLQKMKEQHGSDWKSVAIALGKHRFHVKDAWRRLKSANGNKGHWNQEEYQKLFDLVNVDLRERASLGYRKSKHGMLRDNIGWEAISDKFTRSSSSCCDKWYNKLTSPMVASGVWSDTDDYRLIKALFTLDACCMEEVDWDDLVENRSGDVCRKRWNQMVQCIGKHGGNSFAEQVEILAKRFCPDLLQVREAYDAIPVVCC